MELYTMEYVLAVAECKSFSLAAQNCHIGQPALSQQIAKLERELGIALFTRSAHGVTLTQAGERFVERAREILQMSKGLQSEMSNFAGLKRGSLNLGIITSLQCIDFGRMLSAFCGTYPHIAINIIQNGTHRLIDCLIDRTIDLAFLNRPTTQLPSALHFTPLATDRYSLAVPKAHPIARQKEVSLKQLSMERFIFHQPGQVASELCYNACRAAGFEPHIVCRSSQPSTSIYMVQGGLGVALLPSEEFQFLAVPGVVEVKITEPIIKEVGITWRKDCASPLVNAITQFAVNWK